MKKEAMIIENNKLNNNNSYKNNSYSLVLEKNDLLTYDFSKYLLDVKNIGLKNTWEKICSFILKEENQSNDFFNIDHLGFYYEAGLAIENKIDKKNKGQYYTPDDVSNLMCKWFDKIEGTTICDVGCGTGNLILRYLQMLGYDQVRKLIKQNKLYLYDFDQIALKICKTIILKKYGLDLADKINIIHGDFLNKEIVLPKNCKVISNPPYAKITNFSDKWNLTETIKNTKEFYAAFMEKIIEQANASVIISPYSFISSKKFFSLRKQMTNKNSGYIFSFDNVPGNIFQGKKHGIFNSNTSNAVRAAITIVQKDENKPGFQVSPMIRFKNAERNLLLQIDILEKTLGNNKQQIDEKNSKFEKVDKNLENIYFKWITNSKYKLSDFITLEKTDFLIDIPNTCRYFVTGSSRKLKRIGSVTIYLKNKEEYAFIYCLINSSFSYWWWRIFDGGITYSKGLLYDLPVMFNLLSNEDKKWFNNIFKQMKKKEEEYIITKNNANKIQENIKFPPIFRKKINQKIFSILKINENTKIMGKIHKNHFFKEGKKDE